MSQILPQQIADWVMNARDPQATAVIFGEETCSYRQLAEGAALLASTLPPLTADNPYCVLVVKKGLLHCRP
ncbi:MAG: hypothetical protein XXXJIFNMEKO3_00556 [Candidatus Erwinia impunctatus]|nr:hypothetical protein XXXJIFNMEKO_00556 [Culicoides impunctatus]